MKTDQPTPLSPKQSGKEPDRMDTKKWRRVKFRVLLGFGLLMILIIVMGLITIGQITMLGEVTSTIHQHPLEVSNASLRASMSVAKIRRSMRDIILTDDETDRKAILKNMESEELNAYQKLDIIRDKILGAQGQALEKKSRALLDEWKPIREQAIMLIYAGRLNEATRLTMSAGAEQAETIQTSFLELTSYAKEKADSFIINAENIQRKTKRFMLGFILTGILLSFTISLITLNRLYYAIRRYRISQEETERLLIELQQALSEVKKLSGFLPICASCKKIRDDKGYWNQIETYIRDHSEAQFSHSLCPECSKKLYPGLTNRKNEK